jgi:transcription-repair coupling factor (superfamily II helicase)
MDVLGENKGALHLGSELLPSFRGNVSGFIESLKRELRAGRRVTAFVTSRGLAERFVEILQEEGLSAGLRDDGDQGDLPRGAVALRVGNLTHGFVLPAFEEALFSGRDVFAEQSAPARRPVRKLGRFLSDFRDLKVGDYVVHTEHGIGVFTGLKQMGSADGVSEFVVLEYQGGDRLYVPVERLDLLEKFRSAESGTPRLDKLGGTGWERVKSRVKKSMRDMAQELLQLYAARKSLRGHAFSEDTHWQAEFEDQFEFQRLPI